MVAIRHGTESASLIFLANKKTPPLQWSGGVT
ncbi:MAG: hypothetical protein JWL63_2001 [Rhodocyclales bacterium]|nr:hypothetical protein [Rhodocyclales bacterium]